VEETALATETLLAIVESMPSPTTPHTLATVGTEPARCAEAAARGVAWLVKRVGQDVECPASPIGFYFAKLWYFERLYPLIFAVGALGRAARLCSATPTSIVAGTGQAPAPSSPR
jgi:hypothetical protein